MEQGPVRGHRRGRLRGRPAADRARHRDRAVRGDDDPEAAPIFVKQAYYLEPEPIGRKAFGLLKSVLAEAGLQGICKIVLKDREQLSVLDPYQSTMLLSTIYWPDEVRDLGELDIPAAESEPKPAEIAMAKQLVSAMTGEFEPERYRDEYREALLKVIEAKVDGQPVAVPEPVVETRGLTDLMAVLEASVAAARDARKAAPADGRRRRPTPTTGGGGSRSRSTRAKSQVARPSPRPRRPRRLDRSADEAETTKAAPRSDAASRPDVGRSVSGRGPAVAGPAGAGHSMTPDPRPAALSTPEPPPSRSGDRIGTDAARAMATARSMTTAGSSSRGGRACPRRSSSTAAACACSRTS